MMSIDMSDLAVTRDLSFDYISLVDDSKLSQIKRWQNRYYLFGFIKCLKPPAYNNNINNKI